MKIALLGVQLKALANFRAPLIKDLIAAGHEVIAIAPEPHDAAEATLAQLGAQTIIAPLQRQGMNPLCDLKSFFWLWKTLRAQRPDTILCFQPKAVIYGLPAAFFAGIKRRTGMIEGLGLGFIQEGRGLKRKLVRFIIPKLYRLSLCAAQNLIFLNPDDQAVFTQKHLIAYHTRPHRINGIGVDLVHYRQRPLPDRESLTFLMVARLLVDKGVREYAAAAEKVKAIHSTARFILIGGYDGGPAGIKPEEVATWKALEYQGEVADVRPALADCHVFVLPSYREGVPRSTMEALATGRAIITTDAAGTRETVVAGRNGLFIKVADADNLAQAMIHLIEHPAELGRMAQESRLFAEEKFEVMAINRQIRNIMGV